MRQTVEQRIEQIKPFTDRGVAPRDIARETGLSFSQVYRILRVGRAKGLLLDTRKHDPLRYMTIGTLSKEVKSQPPDFTRWLAKEMPTGVTLAEFAIACLLDLYFEEKEKSDEH